MKILIAVTAFNKIKPLQRLLKLLSLINVPEEVIVDLVITIDGGGDSAVVDVAHDFVWNYGNKIILTHTENLGLKAHMLKTFSLCNDYDGIIVLEDDVIVSRDVLLYVLAAHNFIFLNDCIAGVSLYNQTFNENSRMPFCPIDDGFSNYYLQLPSSWGVYLTKSQAQSFLSWYYEHSSYVFSCLPSNIKRWSDKSWKKHFSSYIASENKYFLYPRTGLTTTLSDKGVHHNGERGVVSPIGLGLSKHNYNFSSLDNSCSVYDSFCELIPEVFKKLNPSLEKYRFTVDLYGYKRKYADLNNDYVLTLDNFSTAQDVCWGASIFPFELNVIHSIEGQGIVLRKYSRFSIWALVKCRWFYMLWSEKIALNARLLSRLLGRG